MKSVATIFAVSTLFVVLACKNKAASPSDAPEVETRTPVTVTTLQKGPMEEYINLNAVSIFRIKNTLKSTVTGYLQSVNVQPGDYVRRGQVLFTVKTKEAESVGNTIAQLDSSFHFKGIADIKATASGYITQLNYQSGDYVQDGEQLASIADQSSFAFLLDLPFELRPYLASNRHVQLVLPDGTVLTGTLTSPMPVVDPVSQTQSILIKVDTNQHLPENLIATVRLLKSSHPNAVFLPKAAVLTDETQSEWWVMQVIGDSMAVKVPIRKGLETGDQVEILSPRFQSGDRMLLTGNYGLPDSSLVKIEQ